MLLGQSSPSQNELFATIKHGPRVNDDLTWRKEREAARLEKIQEQKQTREMLERHWPWGGQADNKPRGLRNLRLEGLFPHRDYEKAKRSVLGMGRPGGGAPNTNEHGNRICRTKEDPLLRFQWGKDLRRCVDNTLRYRMNKDEQARYKRELDKLVAAKLGPNEEQRFGDLVKHHRSDCTNVKDKASELLDRLEKDTKAHTKRIRYNESKNIPLGPLDRLTKNYKCLYGNSNNVRNTCHDQTNRAAPGKAVHVPNRQLAPLRDEGKDVGIELVPLMIEKRRQNPRAHLATTDVTRNGYTRGAPRWVVDGQIYLAELSKQANAKLNELKALRTRELESTRKHFDTLDNFWGRPGHGAPRSGLKKGSIDRMLYGAPRFPVAVA